MKTIIFLIIIMLCVLITGCATRNIPFAEFFMDTSTPLIINRRIAGLYGHENLEKTAAILKQLGYRCKIMTGQREPGCSTQIQWIEYIDDDGEQKLIGNEIFSAPETYRDMCFREDNKPIAYMHIGFGESTQEIMDQYFEILDMQGPKLAADALKISAEFGYDPDRLERDIQNALARWRAAGFQWGEDHDDWWYLMHAHSAITGVRSKILNLKEKTCKYSDLPNLGM